MSELKYTCEDVKQLCEAIEGGYSFVQHTSRIEASREKREVILSELIKLERMTDSCFYALRGQHEGEIKAALNYHVWIARKRGVVDTLEKYRHVAGVVELLLNYIYKRVEDAKVK